MAKQKATRKDLLKSPDEFLTVSGRAIALFSAHRRELEYLGIGLACLAIIYLAGQTYLGYVNKKGQEAYNTAYKAAVKETRPGAKAEDLKKVRSLFQEVLDKRGLSRAAGLVPPHMAYMDFFLKRYDEAIDLYTRYLEDVSDDPRYARLTRLALASCYEAKGDLDAAIKTLKPLTDGPGGLFAEMGLLDLTRVYRLADQADKAKETLKVLSEKFADSPLLPVAKANL